MQLVAKTCPSCGHSNSASASLCDYCGKQLRPDRYRIVNDGSKFGIALNGEIVFDNLMLAKAQNLVAVLNGEAESVA